MLLARFSRRKACSARSMSSWLSSTIRISTSLDCIIRLQSWLRYFFLFFLSVELDLFAGPEAEIKCRAPVQFRLHPDPATVLLNNALHRGQANARALEIFGAVKALEDAEQLIGILHAEADAIVANENGRIPVFFHLADFNDGAGAGTSELKGVSHQILKNLLDQDRIAFNKRKVRDNPFHLPAFTLRL